VCLLPTLALGVQYFSIMLIGLNIIVCTGSQALVHISDSRDFSTFLCTVLQQYFKRSAVRLHS
jgi:hypothetical protein